MVGFSHKGDDRGHLLSMKAWKIFITGIPICFSALLSRSKLPALKVETKYETEQLISSSMCCHCGKICILHKSFLAKCFVVKSSLPI